MVPKHVRCRLAVIMAEGGWSQLELAKRSGIDVERIRKLCNNEWNAVTRTVLAKLCAVLDVDLARLFTVLPEDVWYPIRRDGDITVHLGSTSLERHDNQAGMFIDRLGIGTWDVRGLVCVSRFLNEKRTDTVVFDYAEHTENLPDPSLDALAKGNHLVFGSPIVNPMAEGAVCRGFGVPPHTPACAGEFPYGFRWDKPCVSSFGAFAEDAPSGIVDRTGTLIARRTVIAEGDNGEDCGILYAHRYAAAATDVRPRVRMSRSPTPADADADGASDGICVAVMGHSGCATLAGAELLRLDDVARALYPPQRDRGVMRAFRVVYRRPRTDSGFDNRAIVSAELLPAV